MILFGVNFNVYYLFLIRKPKDALRCEEMRGYLGIILVSTLLITWNIRGMFSGYPDCIKARGIPGRIHHHNDRLFHHGL